LSQLPKGKDEIIAFLLKCNTHQTPIQCYCALDLDIIDAEKTKKYNRLNWIIQKGNENYLVIWVLVLLGVKIPDQNLWSPMRRLSSTIRG